MGVAVGTLEEEAPLLKVPQQQALTAEQELPVAQHPEPAGSWDGHLLQCCGQNCSQQGWVSCAFAYFLPCFAFGHNVRRAFSASLWLHAFVFFLMFYGVHRVFIVAVNVTADSCRADPPPPTMLGQPRPLGANAHETWLSGRKLLQVDDAPGKFAEAFADVLPSAAAHAVVHGGSAEQSAQGEYFDNGVNIATEIIDSEAVPVEAHPLPQEQPRPKDPRPPRPAPIPPHPAIIPFTAVYGRATPGCQRAYMGLFVLFHLAVAALLVGILYAAHQRTLMRRKFSIPGSACGDLLAWLCCSSCALCQETRTLRANKVVNGQWNPQHAVFVVSPEVAAAMAAREAAATEAPKVMEV